MVDALDTSRPSAARIHDHALGGKDNYEVDRQAVGAVLELAPEIITVARENRRRLVRVVRRLVEQGFDQFIDLGSGLPTQENVHQVAQGLDRTRCGSGSGSTSRTRRPRCGCAPGRRSRASSAGWNRRSRGSRR